MRALFLLLTLLLTFTANARLSSSDLQRLEVSLGNNLGFENNLAGWSNSGGTFSHVTESASVGAGRGSASFDASSTDQYIVTGATAIDKIAQGQACGASIYAQNADGYQMQLLDASDSDAVIASASMTADANNFVKTTLAVSSCPSSVKIKIVSTGDNGLVILDGGRIDSNPYNGVSVAEQSSWVDCTDKINLGAAYGSYTDLEARRRRVGDSVEVMLSFKTGTPANTTATIAFNDIEVDGSKLSSGKVMLGVAHAHGGSVLYSYPTNVKTLDVTWNGTNLQFVARGNNNYQTLSDNSSDFFGTGDAVWVRFIAPIKGWSAKKDYTLIPFESGSQYIRYDGHTSIVGASNFEQFKTRKYNKDANGNDTSYLISDENNGTTGTTLTAERDCYFDIWASIYVNNSPYSLFVRRYNSSGTVLETVDMTSGYSITAPINFRMNKGDYIRLATNGSGTPVDASENTYLVVKATPLKATALGALPKEEYTYIDIVRDHTSDASTAQTCTDIGPHTINLINSSNTGVAIVSSNKISLNSGSYSYKFTVIVHPSFAVWNKVALYNVTDSAYVPNYAVAPSYSQGPNTLVLEGDLSLSSTKEYELRVWGDNGLTTYVMGTRAKIIKR
jgi:hypothetical protein